MAHHFVREYCILALVLGLSGCDGGEKGKPTATVSGTVTFNGQPVKVGLVNFESDPPGNAAQGELKDGKFSVNGPVFLGKYKVTIGPPRGAPPIPGQTAPIPDMKDVPKKYESPRTSDLTAEVKKGSNDLKFELK